MQSNFLTIEKCVISLSGSITHKREFFLHFSVESDLLLLFSLLRSSDIEWFTLALICMMWFFFVGLVFNLCGFGYFSG